MKEFFCHFCDFFQKTPEEAQRDGEETEKTGRQGSGARSQETAGPPQDQQVREPAQEHPQQHEQPQAAPAGDAAQEEKQHRGQQGIGKVEKDLQLFQPEAAQECRHQLIEKTEGYAAAQAQQSLQALLAGIDAHQPSSFPRKPRRCSRSSE